MVKKKNKNVAKRPAAKAKRAPAPTRVVATPVAAAVETTYRSGDLARAMLAKLPPLDILVRSSFAKQVTVGEVARLGGMTVAVDVLREAGGWITTIHEARDEHPELARRYSDERFAYFCERVIALEDRLVKEGVRDDAISVVRSGASAAVAQARVERDHLLGVLEPIGRGDPVTAGALSGVRSDLNDEALVGSLEKLAQIAEAWLGRARVDADAANLVRAFGLGEDDVAHARAAAAALGGAAAAARKGGPKHGDDSSESNVLEGILLSEMRVVLGVFRTARAWNPRLPPLVPGPGTKAALTPTHARHAKAKSAPAT